MAKKKTATKKKVKEIKKEECPTCGVEMTLPCVNASCVAIQNHCDGQHDGPPCSDYCDKWGWW